MGVGPRVEDDDDEGLAISDDSGDDTRGMVSEKGEGVGPLALGIGTSKSS